MPGRNVPITDELVLGPDRRETAWIGVVVPWSGAMPWIDVVSASTEVCSGCVASVPVWVGTSVSVVVVGVVMPHGG